jgi:UDP-N-acetylmuramyl pentapeptide synthase
MPSPRKLAKLRAIALEAGLATAGLHRRCLKHVAFVGVTGSCGKTTTKELTAAVLGASLPGRRSPASHNSLTDVGTTVLRTTGSDAFCVVEIAAWEPGSVARAARVVAPNIAVVTNIGADHRKAFRSLEATAAEKAELLSAVARGGTAGLNADDERVRAMAQGFHGRVITYGRSPDASLRAENIRARWPERLSFTLHVGERSCSVSTRLCGEHSLTSALAALGVAHAIGLPLDRAIDALAAAEPAPARMSPVALDGATFILDDAKAPLWTMDAAFAFLRDARAARKLAVIGTLSDYAVSASRAYPSVARRGFAVADEVVFVGRNARHTLKAKHDADARPLHAFATFEEAAEYLRGTLREGDLVLVKGSEGDHLQGILRALTA